MMKAIMHFFKIFSETYNYLKKSKDSTFDLNNLKKDWAQFILNHLQVDLQLSGKIYNDGPVLLLGNHISYLDIPILMSSVEKISFVAKSELKSWPIFGPAAIQAQTVFVQRENKNSRQSARDTIKNSLLDGKRIAIFPSGTTSLHETKPWKKGAFEIARDINVPVQFFRLKYKPLREVAYIDNDFFPLHLFNLIRHKKILAEIEFSEVTSVEDPSFDSIKWNYWSRELLG